MGECQSVPHIRQYVLIKERLSDSRDAHLKVQKGSQFYSVRSFFASNMCELLISFGKGATGRIVNELSEKGGLGIKRIVMKHETKGRIQV